MNLKKTLLIILFVIVAIGLGALIYFVLIRDIVGPADNANDNTNTPVNTSLPNINRITNTTSVNVNAGTSVNVNFGVVNTNTIDGVDGIARGGVTLATEVEGDSVGSVSLSDSDSSLRYLNENTGEMYKLKEDGSKEKLSDQLFIDAEDVSWSPNEDKAIISFPDGSNILYDFNTDTQVTLPKEWDDIEFSPQGSQVAYKHLSANEDSRWLAVASPDGSKVQGIEPLGDKEDDVQIAWSPDSQVVALFREGVSTESQEVYPIGMHGENFKSIKTEGRGFEGKWSPAGDKLLYAVYTSESNFNPTLYVVSASGDNTGDNTLAIGLETWVDKCTFSSNGTTIFCAVPSSLPEGSAWYPELAENTVDIIYKVDLASNSKNVLALPTSSTGKNEFTISSVFLSGDESKLYFIDDATNKIHSIQLR